MIRYSILIFAVTFISVFAFRDWFKALCCSLPIIAFLERPDMPRTLMDISGLNPYNIMLGCVLIGWFNSRKKENSNWIVDKTTTRLILIYIGVLLISTVRGILDPGKIIEMSIIIGRPLPSMSQYIIELFLNTFKWIIPGYLFCVGANTENRVRWAAWAIMITGLMLSLQVISKMAPAFIGADDLATRALRVLDRDLGYHRVDLAAICGSVSWGFLLMRPFAKNPLQSWMMLGGFAICTLGLIGTGGRAGMLAWAAAGFVIGLFKWRRLLLLGPVFALLGVLVIPGLQERIVEGFTEESHAVAAERRGLDTVDNEGRDLYAITSGRVVVWPRVIDKIAEKPFFGHGRIAMQRTGITLGLIDLLGQMGFGHPHNAYLEAFLDLGIIGTLPILYFFGLLGWRSLKFFIKRTDDLHGAVAGLAVGFLTVQSVAAMGSQTFYPKQGSVLLWCTVGLALRYVLNKHEAEVLARAKAAKKAPAPPRFQN